ncbi:hypothetical protein KIW84_062785 [Lathyrus oleraceus]|uniref:Rab3-GAP regulatory subunit N-terminal domain-containing protein n=1 Tax=Pisum sativum TaxID=3888 RepID=A0A9D4W8D8_PEA|nr:hypothetical protein KIW84_062785 [Pisum sativum]
MIYPGQVLKLRVRGTKKDLIQDSSSEDFCLIMPGVIAHCDGSVVQNMLQKWFEEANPQFRNQKQKNQDSEFRNQKRILKILKLSEDKGRSLVGAILSKVVPATFSTIASFSKLIWRSENTSPQKSPKKSEVKPQPFARASPLTCIKDHPRKGEKLTLSPSGTLAAITDSLGRILLLDTQALVVVHLWKGYRDASCLFMEMLVNKDTASSSSTYYEPMKSDYCLCLAIHAPRKGMIEIWQMRTGPRLRTVTCAKGSKMLQPSCRFGVSNV